MKFILFALLIVYMTPCQFHPVTNNGMANPELIGGDVLGIGDSNDVDTYAAAGGTARVWPKGVLFYDIDLALNDKANVIHDAMRHIESKTCIRFVQRNATSHDYVHIFPGDGCNSWVGRGGGQQPMSLHHQCLCCGIRPAAHELMHALGFEHEHQRSDRDNYLEIHWEHIDNNFKYAFDKLKPNENKLMTPFDIDSLMMYGAHAFSKDNGITVTSKIQGRVLKDIPDSQGLTNNDIQAIKTLYKNECH